MSFTDAGVPDDLAASLEERGIKSPFPIQAATLPDTIAGNDLCGKAPTGSGKTLAFSIPLVANIQRSRPKHPRGLVLVPTRELAAQVQEVIEPLAKVRGLRVASVYGGVGFDPQYKALRRGVDIIVACPGRLIDLIERGAVSLADVEFVVLDEADHMADMGFLPSVRHLLDQTNKKRQTLLFSATLDGDVNLLIRKYQTNPVMHEVEAEEDTVDNSLHLFWKSTRNDRLSLTAEAIKRFSSILVFTRTKHGADRLEVQLKREGIRAAAIHGGRSQAQRDRALAAFTARRVRVLVATDVAARGIHVNGVDCVIHFDVPEDDKTYVHRSGRTARAGAEGTVITLVDTEKAKMVTQMQRRLQMAAGVITPNFRALPDESTVLDLVEGGADVGVEEAPSNRGRNGAGGNGNSRRRRPTPATSRGEGQQSSSRPPRNRKRRTPAA